jgi:hypothetical protein
MCNGNDLDVIRTDDEEHDVGEPPKHKLALRVARPPHRKHLWVILDSLESPIDDSDQLGAKTVAPFLVPLSRRHQLGLGLRQNAESSHRLARRSRIRDRTSDHSGAG